MYQVLKTGVSGSQLNRSPQECSLWQFDFFCRLSLVHTVSTWRLPRVMYNSLTQGVEISNMEFPTHFGAIYPAGGILVPFVNPQI